MKKKEINKETFVRFYREEISRANCKEEIDSYKINDMFIFGWRNKHIYTYKENRVRMCLI